MGLKFTATVELHGKTATGIAVPEVVVDSLGAGKRVKVAITINRYTYRTTVAPMGGEFLVPLAAEHREAAGVAAGDKVEVGIALDDAPREVEVPDDLKTAFIARPDALNAYDGLSFTRRKEWVRWITEAKKPETREARVAKTIEGLASGKKTH